MIIITAFPCATIQLEHIILHLHPSTVSATIVQVRGSGSLPDAEHSPLQDQGAAAANFASGSSTQASQLFVQQPQKAASGVHVASSATELQAIQLIESIRSGYGLNAGVAISESSLARVVHTCMSRQESRCSCFRLCLLRVPLRRSTRSFECIHRHRMWSLNSEQTPICVCFGDHIATLQPHHVHGLSTLAVHTELRSSLDCLLKDTVRMGSALRVCSRFRLREAALTVAMPGWSCWRARCTDDRGAQDPAWALHCIAHWPNSCDCLLHLRC